MIMNDENKINDYHQRNVGYLHEHLNTSMKVTSAIYPFQVCGVTASLWLLGYI